MHKMPLDSGFLASKFIQLSEYFDMHLLVWDSRNSIDKFIEMYRLPPEYRRRIHLGKDSVKKIFPILYSLLICFLRSVKVRSYLFRSKGSFHKSLKFLISYLPALFIKPDIIHFEFGTLAKAGIQLKQISSAAISVSFRGYDLNYSGLTDTGYYNEVWVNIDGIHFLGNDIKKRAIARGYKENKQEALIPPGVDVSIFNSMTNASKYETDILKIVSVGRLVWKKGYEYGIRAAAYLKAKGIPFQYEIIGDGQHRQALEFAIHEMRLEKEVRLTGSKDAIGIRESLEKAHVFLHPAISEGFSNAVVEAQAMSVPVVCTDADGLSENVEDGVTGFVVPKWDAQAIAKKLEWCWNHKDELVEMGVAGKERVKSNFTLDNQIHAFVHFYKKLLVNGKN